MSQRMPAPTAGSLSGILHLECARLSNSPKLFRSITRFFQSQMPLPYMARTNIINTSNKYFTTSAFSTQCGKLLSYFLSYIMSAPANLVRRQRTLAETPDAEHCHS